MAVGQTRQFTATGVDLAVAVEAGAFHQCAVLQDGTARCWGATVESRTGSRVGSWGIRRSKHPRSFVYRVDLSAPAFGRTWNGGLAAPTIADIDAVIWK